MFIFKHVLTFSKVGCSVPIKEYFVFLFCFHYNIAPLEVKAIVSMAYKKHNY